MAEDLFFDVLMGVKEKVYTSKTGTLYAVAKEIVPEKVTEGISRAKLLGLLDCYLADVVKEGDKESLLGSLSKMLVCPPPAGEGEMVSVDTTEKTAVIETATVDTTEKTPMAAVWRKDFKKCPPPL